jgi:S-DNA-T family DNA segregation ATPase FtsK/SpoIIIE
MNKEDLLIRVIAKTVFRIINSYFSELDSSEHNCFRVKNLSKNEILDFLCIWKNESEDYGLNEIKVIVAGDSDSDYPLEYKAEQHRSITWYRNHNKSGLIYLETKNESDEQGLKNIFTLQDRNFLDGYVSESINVPEAILEECWYSLEGNHEDKPKLIIKKTLDILKYLQEEKIQLPLKNFIRFCINICSDRKLVESNLDEKTQEELIGNNLFYLNMFPDPSWNQDKIEARVRRRLLLNSFYAELAHPSNTDIETEEVERLCSIVRFKDSFGQYYSNEDQNNWKNLCIGYSNYSKSEIRKNIPFHVFSQLFSKDVKGLKLGERIEQEISDTDINRLAEYTKLNVKEGLDNRQIECAQTLLDAESNDFVTPLSELLTKQTKRMLDKVAFPIPENFNNPLTKLAEIARDFHVIYGKEKSYYMKIRLGKKVNDNSLTIGLFSFLYGATLKSICEESEFDSLGYTLKVEDQLTQIVSPPHLQNESVISEDESITWEPVPIEFALFSIDDDQELDVISNLEWLPNYYKYLSLFWFKSTAPDSPSFRESLVIPCDIKLDDWLLNICNRTVPLNSFSKGFYNIDIFDDPIILDFEENINIFNSHLKSEGLSKEIINELLDRWDVLLHKIKSLYTPDDNSNDNLQFLLKHEIVEFEGLDKQLMLSSHPIRLRWISAYLNETEALAKKALAGELKLNTQNDKLYLGWISQLTPHQQPPISVTSSGNILFASGEQGWCEEFTSDKTDREQEQDSSIDSSSLYELSNQVKSYLDSHPYKKDGLKLLVIIQAGGKFISELINEIRKGEHKNTNITIHVLAPHSIWTDIIDHFEKLPTQSRISEGAELFPPLQLRLHELGLNQGLKKQIGNNKFDLALVPKFLRNQIEKKHSTEPFGERAGRFDPLLDSSTYVYGGQQGGTISVALIPRDADPTLCDWSTLAVRHQRSGPVSKQQPDNTDYIELQIQFKDTAKLYEELHEISHWVLILERYISREQIENLTHKPDILTVRDKVGANGLFTLIVSSNSGKEFIIKRLERKIKNIEKNINTEKSYANELAKNIYEEIRKISPRLVLQAMGISRVTEEILGLMVANHVANSVFPSEPNEGIVVWLSLDEHPEWFNGNNSIRADMCRLTIEKSNDQLYVDLLVVEGKFRQVYDSHGVEQVLASLALFESIISSSNGEEEAIDSRLWREYLLSAMENVNPDARKYFGKSKLETTDNKYLLPEEIRREFRNGQFEVRSIQGLFSICCYTDDLDIKITEDLSGRVKIIQSYQSQFYDLVAGNQKLDVLENELDNYNSKNNIGPDTESNPSIGDKPILESGVEPLQTRLSEYELTTRYQTVLDKFAEFGVNVCQPEDKSLRFVEGPASILYRIKPGHAVAPKRIVEKGDVLKLALALDQEQHIRFGNHKGFVTIDVPKNQCDRYFVEASDMWSLWEKSQNELIAPIGEDSFGNIVSINFSSSNSPHLLIGGTTGSGKSEALNTILDGLIKFYDSDELKLMLVDPKGTELIRYEDAKHLKGSIGWDEADAIELLESAVEEMQNRYLLLKSLKTRSLPEYNERVVAEDKMPWWVIVLDEYADLTFEKETKKIIEGHLKRLAQKARAAGIHVIIATQKPSSEVISTNLRSNLPAQLALRVKSSIESRVIIDESGAETLNGKGDALLKSEGKIIRIQCAKT